MDSRPLRIPGRAILLGLALPLLAPALAAAQQPQPDDPAVLRARVVQLEDRVAELEEYISRLQQQMAAQAGAAVEPAPTAASLRLAAEGWWARENWRRLRQGLGRVEVGHLLGEPARVVVGEIHTIWYYPDALGAWVRFATEGGRVEAWVEP